MGTPTSTPPSLPPPPPSANTNAVQDALTFARATAESEIASIDRLHKRTLLALGIPVAAFGVLLSIAGWVGYTNLKRVAVATTTNVVQERLGDELTEQSIDLSVQKELQKHAAAQISIALQQQIQASVKEQLAKEAPALRRLTTTAVANLKPQIEAAAREQAQLLVQKVNSPRMLDTKTQEALIGAAKRLGPGQFTMGVGGDPEAQHFSAQLAQAFIAGGWKVDLQALLSTQLDLPRYGVVIATTPQLQHTTVVLHLLDCFKTAGIPYRFVVGPKAEEWGEDTMVLVLPKER